MTLITKAALITTLTLSLAGCSYGKTTQTSTPTPQSLPTEAPVKAGSVKEFTITAANWEFTPSTVTVNKGDTVRLTVTATDKAHGLAIPAFKVNQKLDQNQTATVEFVADQAGEFPFFCNVMCGAGHKDMKGTLIVQ